MVFRVVEASNIHNTDQTRTPHVLPGLDMNDKKEGQNQHKGKEGQNQQKEGLPKSRKDSLSFKFDAPASMGGGGGRIWLAFVLP